MGRRDRERVARIRTGLESPRAEQVRATVANVGVATLKAFSTSKQIDVLRESLHTGRLTPKKLREALEDNAHKEMAKGARKLAKKHKPVTVDALLEEYRADKAFRELASEVGLDEEWFVALAEAECKKWEDKQ